MRGDRGTPEVAILDAVHCGLIVLDRNERIVMWNAWMVSASGHRAHTVQGRQLGEVYSDLDLRRLTSAVRGALTSHVSTILTHSLNPSLLPLRTRSGRPLLHDISVAPVVGRADADCLVLITDVTMAVRREQYLRHQQNARYDAVVENAADVIMTIDGDGRIQHANLAAVAQFGIAMNELVGKHADELFESKDDWRAIRCAAMDGVTPSPARELIAVRKDGSITYLEASASRWSISAQAYVTVILRDVNERRAVDAALRASHQEAREAAAALADLNQRLEHHVQERTAQLMKAEEALRQSQKMEAIGQLTGGIAHDFNNLIQGIAGALQVVQKRISAGRIGDLDRFLTGAMESAQRAASLTHRLLAFARQQPVDPRALDVNELIASMEELLRRSVGEAVQLRLASAADLWPIRCDANQLENAILNLALNARDAMPNGGSLTIETRNRVLDVAEARVFDVRPGEYVQLVVRDTGAGMSPEVQGRVFDPFFTTKPIGKGTGLGLSMVYGFVKQSEGAVTMESALGKGTTFEICFPRYHGGVQQDAKTERRAGYGHKSTGEVILVVEDEGIVRLLIVDLLGELGYRVLEAENAEFALRILQSSQRIDLLLADIGLPDMNGRELVDKAIERRPDLKVLFMTGYAEMAASSKFLQGDMEIITKPFVMDVLAARVRDLVQRR